MDLRAERPIDPPRPSRRAWQTLIALLSAAVLIIADVPVAPEAASAGPDPASVEQQFLSLLNRERANNGLGALPRHPGLDGLAREWSGFMLSQDHLHHRPNLAAEVDQRITPYWTRIGENVGVGGSAERLHDAFMASPSHRANVLGDYNSMGVGVATEPDGRIWVTFNFMNGPTVDGTTGLERRPDADLWLTDSGGGVFAFGQASFAGSLGGRALAAPIVGTAPTPSGQGYWLVASDGGVFSFGDAQFFGSTGDIRLREAVVDLAPTPTANGYWLFARDGGVFAFGRAPFFGSTGGLMLRSPIVGATPTPDGTGYWMAAGDGGVFAFGRAPFLGSLGSVVLRSPITGIASTPSGRGYWLVGEDGGIFTFGDARFFGSTGGRRLPSPIEHIAASRSGNGYWLVDRAGRTYAFGDAGSGETDPLATAAAFVDIDRR